MVVEELSSPWAPPSCQNRYGCCDTDDAHHHDGNETYHHHGGNEISPHEEEWGSLFCRCQEQCRWGGEGTHADTGDQNQSRCSRNGTYNQPIIKSLPAVGLVDVSTRAEGLEQLNDLQVADGDVFSILVLSKHVGGMDVINGGEDSVQRVNSNVHTSYPQRAGDTPEECPFYQRAF